MKILNFGLALLMSSSIYVFAKETTAKTVIILDASGSMWGQINKKAKITTAKEALNDFVKNWDQDKLGELGITVYGHRKKKDCKDIEAIVPIGPVGEKEKQVIYKKIQKIQPKGKTPISLAIEQEAKKLKKSGAEVATIILISDGIDSCNADPCETAKKLVKEGIKIKIPVIGFDVDKKAKKQLQCIATATDSVFISSGIGGSDKLTEAIETAIESTKVKIIANDDDFTKNVINSKVGGTAGNILKNDLIDDRKAESSSLNIALDINKNITVDQNGNLIVKEGAPEGQQTIKYTICDKRRTDNCDSAVISLLVRNINNISVTAEQSGKQISANYQFFTINSNGEADEKLEYTCSSDSGKPCMIDLPKGEYIVYATTGNYKGEMLITVDRDKVLTEDDVQKIIVDLK